MVRSYVVLEAPSALGLLSRGVESSAAVLIELGLAARIGAEHAGRVEPEPHSTARDPSTGVVNSNAIRRYTLRLAKEVASLVDAGRFPVVLGGDCSILLGALNALRTRGRYGLLFIDGHTDFYSASTSPTGEAADMDLALATGRGPAELASWSAGTPLVKDEDVVVLGARDGADAENDGSESVLGTGIVSVDLAGVRATGSRATAVGALACLERDELDGFWIHLDVDVLDDAVMPAVDHRMSGGLSLGELRDVLATVLASRRAIGMEVTIFNATLDPTREAGVKLVDCLAEAFVASALVNARD